MSVCSAPNGSVWVFRHLWRRRSNATLYISLLEFVEIGLRLPDYLDRWVVQLEANGDRIVVQRQMGRDLRLQALERRPSRVRALHLVPNGPCRSISTVEDIAQVIPSAPFGAESISTSDFLQDTRLLIPCCQMFLYYSNPEIWFSGYWWILSNPSRIQSTTMQW